MYLGKRTQWDKIEVGEVFAEASKPQPNISFIMICCKINNKRFIRLADDDGPCRFYYNGTVEVDSMSYAYHKLPLSIQRLWVCK